MKAGIVGATGYGGAELIRLLLAHPKFTISALYTSSKDGAEIASHYPHLTEIVPMKLGAIDPDTIKNETDVVFLAVPTGVASELAPQLREAGCTVIDLSGDFRLKENGQYEKWYKKTPAEEKWLDEAVYSIPELNGENVKGSSFISNPGCYPTATILGLAPLANENLIKEDSIIIDAKSGVSGAGQTLSFGTLYSEANENLSIYKVNEHQHIPEIEQALASFGYTRPITFSTHLVPMTRGIMATIYVQLKEQTDEKAIRDLYKKFYENKPFVRVREAKSYPKTKEVAGSNYCDIGISADPRTGRVTIISVIDNLVKGAAGQAIQNANLLFGFEETDGLTQSPYYP